MGQVRQVGEPPLGGLEGRLTALGAPAETLAEARDQMRSNGSGLVELLVQKRVLPEGVLLRALGEQYGLPFWETLPTDHMRTEFTGLVSIQYLKKQRVVPLDTPEGFWVAVNDPASETFFGYGKPTSGIEVPDEAAIISLETEDLLGRAVFCLHPHQIGIDP